MSAVICAIAKYENLYIDEWIKYHRHIGFDKIYLIDNSNEYTLEGIDQKYPGFVEVTHLPLECLQIPAYNTFLYNFKDVHTWCAFIDIDEFIVLRKHENIKQLLTEHCSTGALSLNWIMFGSSGHKTYNSDPVRKRFTMRHAEVNDHVKTIAHLPSTSYVHIHHCDVHQGTCHDTNGNIINSHVNTAKTTDVAVIHHYICKSYDEFITKINRGQSYSKNKRGIKEFADFDHNDIEDVSAWTAFPE